MLSGFFTHKRSETKGSALGQGTGKAQERGKQLPGEVWGAIDGFTKRDLPRLTRLWLYYRNPMRVGVGLGGMGGVGGVGMRNTSRWYRLAQEAGLPPRTAGRGGLGAGGGVGGVGGAAVLGDDRALERREVVIENDIAWRVQAMVDFMFGKPVTIKSKAQDPGVRMLAQRIVNRVLEASGGIAFLQDMALLGQVYGHVDVVLRIDPAIMNFRGGDDEAMVAHAGRALRFELVEPRRGIAVVSPRDYRELTGYIIHDERKVALCEEASGKPGSGATGKEAHKEAHKEADRESITEVIDSSGWQVYRNGVQVFEERLNVTGGRVPVVHIQNIAEPFSYGGQGEVEPLIPLQDELNTRLSDRASRVTMQSFKMYLAKGISGFEKSRIGPGQLWSTDNVDASIESFGGDAASPSEESHIREIREALDKISGIPPLASGVVQAKIGNLSSANALRITLMAVLSKTARKRITYGNGITRLCDLVLRIMHHAGILLTREEDRDFDLIWRDPLPEDSREVMQAAEAKARLGVPQGEILRELGYGPGEEMGTERQGE